MAAKTLFPPVMPSSLPAITEGSTLKVRFNISNLTSSTEIHNIQFTVKYQNTNQSAVKYQITNQNGNKEDAPTDIIYFSEIIKDNLGYYCEIPGIYLDDGWKSFNYYKIQARYGYSNLPMNEETGEIDFSQIAIWERKQIEENLISEWSTVTVVKVIPIPTTGIIGLTTMTNGILEGQDSISNTGSFTGYYYCADPSEVEDSYRFVIYKFANGNKLDVVHDSGVRKHDTRDDYYIDAIAAEDKPALISSIDIYHAKTLLESGKDYYIEHTVTTKNNWTTTNSYSITILDDTGTEVAADLNCLVDREEAYIGVYLTSDAPLLGNYAILRSSAASNYTQWEDVCYFNALNKKYFNELIFTDYMIESGEKYKYGIQSVNISENSESRGSLTYDVFAEPVYCFYEYTYLYENGRQLKLLFDNKVGNFKQTHLESKTDTMGSKYPFVTRNGITSYHEMSLQGLVSYFMDEAEAFLGQEEYAWVDWYPTHNLIDENIYTERQFRKEVVDWLNNGHYKLLKSPTEGIMIVALLNTSFSPVETVNRMLYSFSTSAYEINDFSLNSMVALGIHNLGELAPGEGLEGVEVSGQVVLDAADGSVDVISAILENEQNAGYAPEGYVISLDKLHTFRVTAGSDDGEEVIKLSINNIEYLVGNRKVFVIQGADITSMKLLSGSNVIIDYSCTVNISEPVVASFKFARSSFIFNSEGQLQGNFSNLTTTAADYSLDILEEIKKAEEEFYSSDTSLVYTFHKLAYIHIEAEYDTLLNVNGAQIIVGPTASYTLQGDALTDISIAFEQPTAAIINYQCIMLKEAR